jgi:hypothetical protein
MAEKSLAYKRIVIVLIVIVVIVIVHCPTLYVSARSTTMLSLA